MIVSRQRDWQRRNNELGKCTHCGGNPVRASKLCFRHFIIRKIARAGLLKGHPTDKNRVRRENLIAHLFGRYHAIIQGFLQPVGADQALKDAVEIRHRLGITWGGIRGAQKVADIILRMERHAVRSRKEIADGNVGLSSDRQPDSQEPQAI